MSVERLNALSVEELTEALTRCCGAHRWVLGMVAARPYPDLATLHHLADEVWAQMGREDILEAFRHHPRIGDVEGLRKKFASTAAWASGEQAAVSVASEEVLRRLAEGNRAYEERFGYIFIVCATGKSAAEMLVLLERRLPNPPDQELPIAAAEQAAITHLRLDKMVNS